MLAHAAVTLKHVTDAQLYTHAVREWPATTVQLDAISRVSTCAHNYPMLLGASWQHCNCCCTLGTLCRNSETPRGEGLHATCSETLLPFESFIMANAAPVHSLRIFIPHQSQQLCRGTPKLLHTLFPLPHGCVCVWGG